MRIGILSKSFFVGVMLITSLQFLNSAFAEEVVLPKGEGLSCQRIVSVSPALSDMILDLKLAENIVGATRYCQLPVSDSWEIVGGYFDLNFEKVVSLNPDIVFLEGNVNNPVAQRLSSLGIKNKVFSLDRIDEIEAAKQEIGHYCEGEMILASQTLREKLSANVPADIRSGDAPSPKVLMLYNYGDSAGKILPKLAVGRSFHGELLTTLGFENVYVGSMNAPELTREAISLLNPEWIFILNSDLEESDDRGDLVIGKLNPKWDFLSNVQALKKGQVYELKGFYTQIPSEAAMVKLGQALTDIVYPYVKADPKQ